MRRLLQAVERLYRQAPDGPLAAAVPRLGIEPRLGAGRRKPVAQFVGGAVELAKQGPLAEIADAFAAIEPSCDWLQNPNYSEASLGPGYADRYGYVELVGPGRPIESADLLVGLLMLGPGMHYRITRIRPRRSITSSPAPRTGGARTRAGTGKDRERRYTTCR